MTNFFFGCAFVIALDAIIALLSSRQRRQCVANIERLLLEAQQQSKELIAAAFGHSTKIAAEFETKNSGVVLQAPDTREN